MKLPTSGNAAHLPTDRVAATWLGHSTFLLHSPKGRRILLDPWLGNPQCPESAKKIDALDLLLVTHGHSDHCADAVGVGRATGARVLAPYELGVWFERQGLKNVCLMNVGGREVVDGIDVVMVPAIHSSSAEEGGQRIYLGEATGFIVRFENGETIYFAGDTALFGDMKILRERYAPSVAFLPIGDRYTMGPEDAALAGEWLGVKTIVPMHYGTFPELTGTPDQLRRFCGPRGIGVLELRPGERSILNPVAQYA